MRRPRPSQLVTLIAVAFCLALPAGDAIAQDSSSDPSAAQYDPPIPGAEGTESSSASGAGSGLEANLGFLPFTGLDLLIVVGTALVLTGTGFALRRLATPRPPIG